MARRAVDPNLLAQAKAVAFLKTNPEASQLSQLLQTAASDYLSQVAVNQGAARGVTASINSTVPQVKRFYGQAQGVANNAQTVVDQRLAPLSPVADAIKAASITEHAGHLRRLGESRASTLGEFASRKVDAKIGAAFAVQNAGEVYRSDAAKLNDRLLNVQREKGAATTVALQAAIDRQQKGALTRRGQNITRQNSLDRTNAAAARVAASAKAKKQKANQKLKHQAIDFAYAALTPIPATGKPKAESGSSRTLKHKVFSTQATIRRLRGRNLPGTKITKRLANVDPLVLNVARDLEYLHYVSPHNINLLRQIGVTIPASWRKH